jgi:hypothetical protein
MLPSRAISSVSLLSRHSIDSNVAASQHSLGTWVVLVLVASSGREVDVLEVEDDMGQLDEVDELEPMVLGVA